VLLLLAPNKHKVRIEVGYGLEGTLTDALSSVIISSAMVPRFKAKDFTGGIERGIDGIIGVLSGVTTDWQPKPSVRTEDPPSLSNELFTIFFVPIAIFRDLVADPQCTRHPVQPICETWWSHNLLSHRRFVGLAKVGWRFRRWRRRVWRRLFGWRRLVGRRWRVRKLVMSQ
jgi:uncharacterized membrane protein YgcG